MNKELQISSEKFDKLLSHILHTKYIPLLDAIIRYQETGKTYIDPYHDSDTRIDCENWTTLAKEVLHRVIWRCEFCNMFQRRDEIHLKNIERYSDEDSCALCPVYKKLGNKCYDVSPYYEIYLLANNVDNDFASIPRSATIRDMLQKLVDWIDNGLETDNIIKPDDGDDNILDPDKRKRERTDEQGRL